MIVCFGYSRKSPDDEEETERSINNQNELIATICKGKDWKLLKIFSDKNISGGDNERKGISECISEARKFKVSNPKDDVYIIVKNSKRFARESGFFKSTLKNLDAYGIKVFSVVKNNFLDYTDIGDRIMSVIDEQVILDGIKNAEITQGLKLSKNLPCIPAPFGYRYNPKKEWEMVKKEAKVVVEVLQGFVDGEKYSDIVKRLNINKSLYYRIIKASKKGLYNGWIVFEKKVKDSQKNIVRVEEVKYMGNHKPIISKELFEKVGFARI